MAWNSEAREAINLAIAAAALHERPVAVFDFDNTCILNDIGELYAHYLVEEMAYRLDLDAFWELIDPVDGREGIRVLADEAIKLDPADRASSDVYKQYVAELGSVYGRRLAREGKRDCYAWAVRLHVGLTSDEMLRLSRAAIERELNLEPYAQELHTSRGEVLRVERGVRRIREIRELFQELHDAGVEVWIVSASNRWTVAAFAPQFGVDPSRVIGNQIQVQDGVLTSTLVEPALFSEGKVEAIMRDIGRLPILAFGDSDTDWNMLENAEVSCVFIDTGSKDVVARARANGWAVQPQTELTWDKT